MAQTILQGPLRAAKRLYSARSPAEGNQPAPAAPDAGGCGSDDPAKALRFTERSSCEQANRPLR